MNLTALLKTSMEDAGLTTDATNLETELVEQLPVVTDQLETAIDEALNEVVDTDNAVKQNEELIEEVEGAAATLESIQVSIESSLADGGMSRQTADMQHIALNAALRRLGVSTESYQVSLESFGGEQDRLVVTQEAAGKVGEVLAGLWKALKDMVAKAYEAVKAFFLTIGKGTGALKRGAEILKSKAKGMEKDAEFDATSYAKSMHLGGKFDGASTIAAGFKAFEKASEAELKAREVVHTSMVGIKAAELSKEGIDKASDNAAKLEAADALGAIELPGGRVYEAKAFTIKPGAKAEFTGKAEVKVNKAAVEQIAGEVISFVAFLDAAAKKADDLVKKLNADVDALKADANVAEDKAAFAKQRLGLASKVARVGTRGITGVPAGAATFAKQALSFGAKATSVAGVKAEAKEPAAA